MERVHKMNISANNTALAFIFNRMAECYHYLGNKQRFREIAYENVAKVLGNMKEDISYYAGDVKSLDEIGGIGESIAEKIIEFLHTGKIKTFEHLKKIIPYDLLELTDHNGIGAATLRKLHNELNINTRKDLIQALENNKLYGLKGFGEKKIGILKNALKIKKETKRLLLHDAEFIGNELLQLINKIPGVKQAVLAGSLRRKKDTIGDIDIIVLAATELRNKIVTKIITLPPVYKVLAKGKTKVSVLLSNNNVQVDIRLVNENEFGAALIYFTGSKEHNIKLRALAKQKGLKINEYGIFDAVTGKRLAGKTEDEMYSYLNLKFIPPHLRLGTTEIEQAMKKYKNSIK